MLFVPAQNGCRLHGAFGQAWLGGAGVWAGRAVGSWRAALLPPGELPALGG